MVDDLNDQGMWLATTDEADDRANPNQNMGIYQNPP